MNKPSVVVVGGGPSGLTLAILLARFQVPVLLVEKHHSSSAHPRAIGFTTRSIEIFREAGVALPEMSATWATGSAPRRAKVANLASASISAVEQHWTPPPAFSSTSPSASPSPPSPSPSPVSSMAIAQDVLEPLLRAHAVKLGVDLRMGTELVSFSQHTEGGVTAIIEDRSTRGRSEVAASYLVGADGCRSLVRTQLGIPMKGVGHLRSVHSVLFRDMRGALEPYLAGGIRQFELPDGSFLTTYGDHRWALMSPAAPESEREDPGALLDRIHAAVGAEVRAEVEILAEGRWELSAQVADTFTSGRVMLAGDAAHTLPPNRGGYGANTGIEDAHCLAWRLKAAIDLDLQGLAGCAEGLLQSYSDERRSIALLRHDQIFARPDYSRYLAKPAGEKLEATVIIDDLAMELGQRYSSRAIRAEQGDLPPARRPDEWKGQPGTRCPHLWMDSAQTLSLIDLVSGRLRWTVVALADSMWACKPADCSKDPELVLVPSDPRGILGLNTDYALLVRPDGYIAARLNSLENPHAVKAKLISFY